MLAAAKRVLPPQSIPFDADFFTDLGGHSLLAARFVSAVRETPALASITLQDVYAARTLRADGRASSMAKRASAAPMRGPRRSTPPPLDAPLPLRPGAGGGAAVHPGLMTAQWLGVFVSYMLLTDPDTRDFPRDHFAAQRLWLHQRGHCCDRDRRQMADRRPHQARPLPALGRLLLPVVAGAAPDHADPHEVVPGLAADGLFSGRARRESRRRCDHRRYRNRRRRSHLDRRRREHRFESAPRQCARRRQRAHHRLDRYRR